VYFGAGRFSSPLPRPSIYSVPPTATHSGFGDVSEEAFCPEQSP
jgi:hypothetical protein